MKKRLNVAKLPKMNQFPNEVMEKIRCEITSISQDVFLKKISLQEGSERLHYAAKDLLTMYYHFQGMIAQQKHLIMNNSYDPEEIRDLQIKRLMESFYQFKDGLISFETWKETAINVERSMKSEIMASISEIDKLLKFTKNE